MPHKREIFLAPQYPSGHYPEVKQVRSTLLTASLQGVRHMGWEDRYFAALPHELHDQMRLLTAGTWVPIGHIAFGRPGRVYPPDEAPAVHEQLSRLNFMRYVFGVDPEGKNRTEIMAEAMAKYSGALAAHADDTLLAK